MSRTAIERRLRRSHAARTSVSAALLLAMIAVDLDNVPAATLISQSDDERRRFPRVRISLHGRYLLPDGREFPCQVLDVSPGGIALLAPVIPAQGDRVIAYIDRIGRLEGSVARHIPDGFAMMLVATEHKRHKLAARLPALAEACAILSSPADRDTLGLPENRRHVRAAPCNPGARLILPDGLELMVRVTDISLSGAAIRSEHPPEISAPVIIGKTRARVVRHFDGGFAVNFSCLQHPDRLEENVTAGYLSSAKQPGLPPL
jgi:hypothetical protein